MSRPEVAEVIRLRERAIDAATRVEVEDEIERLVGVAHYGDRYDPASAAEAIVSIEIATGLRRREIKRGPLRTLLDRAQAVAALAAEESLSYQQIAAHAGCHKDTVIRAAAAGEFGAVFAAESRQGRSGASVPPRVARAWLASREQK